jgi:hypothetical protein
MSFATEMFVSSTQAGKNAMNPNISRRRHAKAAQAREQRQSNGNAQAGHSPTNVGEMERQVSLIGGTVLAVCGLLRGSLSGLSLAAIGGALIWRGYTGHCELYQALGHSSADQKSIKHGDNDTAHDSPRLAGQAHRAVSHTG